MNITSITFNVDSTVTIVTPTGALTYVNQATIPAPVTPEVVQVPLDTPIELEATPTA